MSEHEHQPLTDAELAAHETMPTWVEPLTPLEVRLIADLREARRLLRAVEWSGVNGTGVCPLCEVMDGGGHTPTCDIGRYLAVCEGKEQP